MRQHFKISRASEYFESTELAKRTGMARQDWKVALLKELMDNALDITDDIEDPKIEIRTASGLISVWDNGPGMSCDLIKQMLDFGARVSDKSAYMGPTRGQQGNAFKTFLGIAHNWGGHVEIESQNVRHTITCKTNPAGDIDVNHIVDNVPCTGTKVTITSRVTIKRSLFGWALRYHLVNPFVQIDYFSNNDESGSTDEWKHDVLYKSGSLDKIKVTDPMSPHWFDAEKFRALAFLSEREEVPLGQFIGSFHGLKTSKKKKAVAAGLDMTTIASDPEQAEAMLDRMKAESRPINPKKLGLIGEKTLTDILTPDRHWYKKASGVHGGKPWSFEIIVAECEYEGLATAVNHSITFEDFTSGVLSDGWMSAWSLRDAISDAEAEGALVMVHYISISPEFKSLGKDKIDLPKPALAAIARQIRLALTALHKEKKANDKPEPKSVEEKEEQTTFKEMILEVMPEAISIETEDGTLASNRRNLFYKARPLWQAIHGTVAITYARFFKVLNEYWQEHGRDRLIQYFPRGSMVEPHTRTEVKLGTKGVDNYWLPEYRFNKILYIEKTGLDDIIFDAGLCEKYDMALMSSQGYATEAARELLAQADGEDITIFCFHDCDIGGYEIQRTLAEATDTMPDHNIRVEDIGLKVKECLEMELPFEDFNRPRALPAKLKVNAQEREFFEGVKGWYDGPGGKPIDGWVGCKRCEINVLGARGLVEYLDRFIGEYCDGPDKVIPPDDVQRDRANNVFEMRIERVAEEHYKEQVVALQDALKEEFILPENRELDVEEYLETNKRDTWKNGVDRCVSTFMGDLTDEIEEFIENFDEE